MEGSRDGAAAGAHQPDDEEHTEAATDIPMQMSVVSISSLAAKVRYAASGFASHISQLAQPLQDMRRNVGAHFASAHGQELCAACWLFHTCDSTMHVPTHQPPLQIACMSG